MRLLNAARYFDDIALTDPYTGFPLAYKAQFSTFDETDPDGSVSRSRSMSLAPGLALPPRRAVSLLGETWLLGDPAMDGVLGRPIRQTVPMRRATEMFSVLTPGQAILAEAGIPCYGRKDYLKDTVDGTTSSEYFPFYNLYFASTETSPQPRSMFRGPDGRLYRCRSLYVTKDGMACAQCDLMDKASVTYAEFGSEVYDPISDTYAAGLLQMPAIIMLPHQLFNKRSQSDATFHAGDLTLLIRQIDFVPRIVPKVGQKVSVDASDLEWVDTDWWSGVTPAQVLNVTSELDAWNLHIRRV
jgi:hypothetical protein